MAKGGKDGNSGVDEVLTSISFGKSSLISYINKNASRKTADRILENMGAENLRKPDFEVHPQMRHVSGLEYYKCNCEELRNTEVAVCRKCFLRQKKQLVKNQFTMEVGLQQELDDQKFIMIDEVLQGYIKEENSITAIVGSAGSGKTTLMRRIARRALKLSLSKTEDISDPCQHKYKLIHFIEIKDVQDTGIMKPSKFLFGGLCWNEVDEELAYQWLLNNQSESLLFFNGLDQASWQINNRSDNIINSSTLTDGATIMYNILSRNLLKDTKIVISSREFEISELPAGARPADIITLSGLTLDDAQKSFVFMIGPDGDKVWENVCRMSPWLLNLISVPVFLVLTAVVMAKDPNKSPPMTATGLYQKIISTLIGVKNNEKVEGIVGIIKKLKAMAYRGIKEERMVFNENDMRMFKLSKEEVRDLMIKVPRNKLIGCNHLEDDFSFVFCYQSLHEFLAADFVAEMALVKFMSFNYKHLHKERWSVVRRFVCGIIYDTSRDHLHEVSNRWLKQKVMTRSIRLQLRKNEDRHVRMELYAAIYETDDDMVIKQLSVINASQISLSRDEAHIVGSLAARTKSLNFFNLSYCEINDELLAIITGCLRDRIHVKEVRLIGNNSTATAVRSLLGHSRIKSQSGKLDWEVLVLTAEGYHIELENEKDVIKIICLSERFLINKFEGYFNVKESALVFKVSPNLPSVLYLGLLFDAKFLEHLYANKKELPELSKSKLEKISKILIDCTEEKYIDWSLIETSSEKYQVDLLDIAVNGQTYCDADHRILEHRRKISGFHVNIHAMFIVWGEHSFREIKEACQQMKIEYVRCIFENRIRASLEEISSLVNNSNFKKVTLIYMNAVDMLKGDELKKAQKIANDLDTELEFLEFCRQITNSRERFDIDFYDREEHKLWEM